MPAYTEENNHKKPVLTIDKALKHLVINQDKLDYDQLLALGGIIAARKENGTYTPKIQTNCVFCHKEIFHCKCNNK